MQVTNTQSTAELNEGCKVAFDELNSCLNPKYRFIVLSLSDDEQEIFVSHKQDINSSIVEAHNSLLSLLPDQNPSWVAYNFPYLTVGGGKRNKVAIINWVPDTLTRGSMKDSARVKMMAVCCNGKVKRELKGAVCFIQANCVDDLKYDLVLEKISRYEREPIDYEVSKTL